MFSVFCGCFGGWVVSVLNSNCCLMMFVVVDCVLRRCVCFVLIVLLSSLFCFRVVCIGWLV